MLFQILNRVSNPWPEVQLVHKPLKNEIATRFADLITPWFGRVTH